METNSAVAAKPFVSPQLAHEHRHELREVTCSKCGQSLNGSKLERPVHPLTLLRRAISEAQSITRDQNRLRAVAHLFNSNKSALDGAHAELKKEAYRVKDALQQAAQNAISDL